MGIFIMKEIKLSKFGKNRGKYVALVDDEDFEYLNQFNWNAHFDGHNYYAVRTVYNPKKTIRMHRIVMNTPDDMEPDHIDHNGLNCQKYNMRNCTHIENIKNKNAIGKSKFLGVSYRGLKIRATIKVNKKCIHLGYFKSELDAALAYDLAAKTHHKEFANLNFKDGILRSD